MPEILRDSTFGQLVRLFMRRKVFLYPEEKPGFEADRFYSNSFSPAVEAEIENTTTSDLPAGNPQGLRDDSGSISKFK